jgi:hypothetical protein
MADNHPQVGAIGVSIEYVVKENGAAVNIAAAASIKLRLQKPNGGATTEYTAALKTDGSDGILRYVTTSAAELDVPGTWIAQPSFSLSGFNGKLGKRTFYVANHI